MEGTSMELLYSGWLTKQGGKHKNWKRRWFEIRGAQMRYFKEPSDTDKLLGEITLAFPLDVDGRHQRMIEEIPETPDFKRKNVFVIKSKHEDSRPYMLQCETAEDMRRCIDVCMRCIYSPLGGGMFGDSLVQQAIKEGKGPDVIPVLVQKCIDYLETTGLKEPGIFRQVGRVSRVIELRDSFNKGENPDISKEKEVHAIGSLLKRYLRDLPEPLLTIHRFDGFLSAAQVYQENAEQGMVVLKQFIRDLPCANAYVLRRLSQFLNKVAKHADVNKMTAGNLAVVFAPSFLQPPSDATPDVLVQCQSTSQQITKLLIENPHEAFSLMPEPDDEDLKPFRTISPPKPFLGSQLSSMSLDLDDDDETSPIPMRPTLPSGAVLSRVKETIPTLPKLSYKTPHQNGANTILTQLKKDLDEERKQRFLLENQVRRLKEEIEDLTEANEDLKEDLATEQVLRLAKQSKRDSVMPNPTLAQLVRSQSNPPNNSTLDRRRSISHDEKTMPGSQPKQAKSKNPFR